MNRGSIPTGVRDFSPLYNAETDSDANSASFPMGIGPLSSGEFGHASPTGAEIKNA
jgi:hypothetical protein